MILKGITAIAALMWLSAVHLAAATFTVTNTLDDGPGSLRQAITDANLFPGLDTIAFNIPGAGVHTIRPEGDLSQITDPVNIDGYTQPGSAPNTLPNGNNAVLLIELKGSQSGLRLVAGGSTVRGMAILQCDWGITITGGNGNTIAGNFIGIHATGAPWTPNLAFPGRVGIEVGSSYNMIGGVTPAARNVISGWTDAWPLAQGSFRGGILIDSFSVGNVIQGNFIGTDPSGLITNYKTFLDPIFGNSNGITIAGHYNVVGGTVPEARNVIAGNVIGVAVVGFAGVPSLGNKIQGNAIGTDITGRTALPNYVYGIIVQHAAENIIGGTESGTGNVIAYNGGGDEWRLYVSALSAGVALAPPNIGPTPIRGNSIFANGFMRNTGTMLGIDLGNDGVTPNDDGDPIVIVEPNFIGAISWQNFPVLTSVTVSGGNTTIQGTLNSRASNAFELDFFANSAADPTGYGEGEFFLGWTAVNTDDNGNASFSVTFPIEVPGGYFISSTATASADETTSGTSEFSQVIQVIPTLSINDVTAMEGPDDARTDFTFTVSLSGPSSQTVTVACATADGTAKSNSDYFPVPPVMVMPQSH